ncbi:MAG: exodeoxyribonuclease III [Candidatus Krumholzibacteriia bacterium]
MRIASWNVNSVRARQDRVLEWLDTQQIGVLCMQETKVPDDRFPTDAFRELGYGVALHGQKTYNGVAIVSTEPLADVRMGFEDGEDEGSARLLSATVRGVRVFSAYVPNGQVVGSSAYEAKLRWLERLRALLERRHGADEPVAVCGDFNIAAEERDVHDPEFWRTQVLFHPTAREALQHFCAFGMTDTFRLHHQEAEKYSWWDYRQLAFPKNRGLRIDYVFATPALADRCTDAWIDRDARKGPSPSDHAPVVASFEV